MRSLARFSLVSLFAGLCLNCSGWAQDDKEFSTKPSPTWAAQIPSRVKSWPQPGCRWFENDFTALAIDSANQPIASLYSHCRDDKGNPVHNANRIVKLSADSGNVIAEREWIDLDLHGRFGTIQLVALHDGKLLVAVGPYLKLLDDSLEQVAQLDFTSEKTDSKDTWELAVSPSRNIALLRYFAPSLGGRDSTLHWIDVRAGLKEFATEHQPHFSIPAVVVDNGFYYTMHGGIVPAMLQSATKAQLQLSSIWFHDREKNQDAPICETCPFSPQAVLPTNKVIGSWVGDYSTFGLFDQSGKELWRKHCGGGSYEGNGVYAAIEADIFLITCGHVRDRLFRAGHTLENAILLDASRKRELYSVTIDVPAYVIDRVIEISDIPRAAINGRGNAFAILKRSHIKYFRVPSR